MDEKSRLKKSLKVQMLPQLTETKWVFISTENTTERNVEKKLKWHEYSIITRTENMKRKVKSKYSVL